MAFRIVTGLVPSVTYHSSTRRLLTNTKRPTSSTSKSRSLQPVSGRFSPAGKRVAVETRQKLQTPAPIILVLQETEREVPGLLFSPAENLHINDVGKEPTNGNYWRFAFPRGACPKVAWWDQYKPVGTNASELRWTSGLMYPCFWKRFRVALAFSGTMSSLLGGAGVLFVVSHTDGLVPMGTGLSVFAALTLPSLFYGIFRSRALQEAWMGLVGGRTLGRGDSMLPYIHPDSKWEYEWLCRPTNVKAGDVVSFRSVIIFGSRDSDRQHGQNIDSLL